MILQDFIKKQALRTIEQQVVLKIKSLFKLLKIYAFIILISIIFDKPEKTGS